MALLDAVEEVPPAGKKEWQLVHRQFRAWARENGHPLHSEMTVEIQFKAVSAADTSYSLYTDEMFDKLVQTTKPTGNAKCPPEVERAHELGHLISNRVASGAIVMTCSMLGPEPIPAPTQPQTDP